MASYKKLWKLFRIAKGKEDVEEQKRIAKKLVGVAKGLYKKKLIEKMPTFPDLGVI